MGEIEKCANCIILKEKIRERNTFLIIVLLVLIICCIGAFINFLSHLRDNILADPFGPGSRYQIAYSLSPDHKYAMNVYCVKLDKDYYDFSREEFHVSSFKDVLTGVKLFYPSENLGTINEILLSKLGIKINEWQMSEKINTVSDQQIVDALNNWHLTKEEIKSLKVLFKKIPSEISKMFKKVSSLLNQKKEVPVNLEMSLKRAIIRHFYAQETNKIELYEVHGDIKIGANKIPTGLGYLRPAIIGEVKSVEEAIASCSDIKWLKDCVTIEPGVGGKKFSVLKSEYTSHR